MRTTGCPSSSRTHSASRAPFRSVADPDQVRVGRHASGQRRLLAHQAGRKDDGHRSQRGRGGLQLEHQPGERELQRRQVSRRRGDLQDHAADGAALQRKRRHDLRHARLPGRSPSTSPQPADGATRTRRCRSRRAARRQASQDALDRVEVDGARPAVAEVDREDRRHHRRGAASRRSARSPRGRHRPRRLRERRTRRASAGAPTRRARARQPTPGSERHGRVSEAATAGRGQTRLARAEARRPRSMRQWSARSHIARRVASSIVRYRSPALYLQKDRTWPSVVTYLMMQRRTRRAL